VRRLSAGDGYGERHNWGRCEYARDCEGDGQSEEGARLHPVVCTSARVSTQADDTRAERTLGSQGVHTGGVRAACEYAAQYPRATAAVCACAAVVEAAASASIRKGAGSAPGERCSSTARSGSSGGPTWSPCAASSVSLLGVSAAHVQTRTRKAARPVRAVAVHGGAVALVDVLGALAVRVRSRSARVRIRVRVVPVVRAKCGAAAAALFSES
jgi:hypothetical protein